MKKIVSITLALIMMLACASTVFAAAVPSVSGGIKVVSGDASIVAYADRDNLDATKKAELEKAYAALSALGVTVSDLFDLAGEGSIALSADSLAKFSKLLKWNGEAWEEVKAEIDKDGNLVFTADNAAYAIVVKDDAKEGTDKPTSPQTNDTSVYFIAASAMFALCAVASIAVSKKKSIEK